MYKVKIDGEYFRISKQGFTLSFMFKESCTDEERTNFVNELHSRLNKKGR